MARPRTQLHLSHSQNNEMHRLLETERDSRVLERLRFLSLAAMGDYTLEELASRAGRSRSTIQNWLAKFQDGGLEELLKRETAPGRVSPLSKPEIQRQLSAAIRSGKLKTAAEIAYWLKSKHRIKRSRKSIYYWLKLSPGTSKPATGGRFKTSHSEVGDS